MFNKLLALILLSLFTAPTFAEIYQCIDKGVTTYSTQPCADQFIDLELDDRVIEPASAQQERFITPVYPSWKSGWKKNKEIQLERFHEITYAPVAATESQKNSSINLQQLTNLPHSMNAQRFATSVADIIESICVNTVIEEINIGSSSDNLFYGQYACSLRRDTQRGEFGIYKIIRGENSIYMVAIKWSVDSFEIEDSKSIALFDGQLSGDSQREKIAEAKRYLKNAVKLCRTERCF